MSPDVSPVIGGEPLQWIPRARIEWTPQRDDVLMELIADGHSFSRVAGALGTTKNSTISRFYRLRDGMGWQTK